MGHSNTHEARLLTLLRQGESLYLFCMCLSFKLAEFVVFAELK